MLLRNAHHLLPFTHAPAHIAVIGPNADSLDALVGNYNGTPSHPVTVLAGIRQRFPRSQVTYVEGTGLIGPVTPASPKTSADVALGAARKADLIVFVAGLSPHIEGEEMKIHTEGFSGGDRTSLDLPAPQKMLLEHVEALGKPVVLVLMSGSALGINWADQHIPAIVEAWYPGEEGGAAVAALLAGDFSPAGRLPVTFYKSVDQLPAFDDYSMSSRTYRYFKGEPLYPFGFGLSYTSFRYTNLHVSKSSISPNEPVTVSVDVTNRGARAGDEVVELYLTHEQAPGAPQRALKGFQRIHLASGQTRHVEFTLRDRALGIVNESGKHRIVPGTVDVWVGGGQPVSRPGLPPTAGLATRFSVNGSRLLPD